MPNSIMNNNRWMSLRLLSLAIVLVIISGESLAIQLNGMFQDSIQVKDQSSQVRKNALKTAFTNVLIRLSGSKKVVYEQRLAVALENPQPYLLSFNYKEILTNSDSLGSTANEESAASEKTLIDPQLLVTFEFDAVQIQNLFVDNNLAIWPHDRPEVMVWWGVSYSQSRRFIVTQSHPFKTDVIKNAELRGLPIQLPIMDIQDENAITLSDLWALDLNQVESASRRYGGQVLLLAKSTETSSGDLFTQWGLQFEGKVQWFEDRHSNFKQTTISIYDQVAEILAKEYAIVMDGQLSLSLDLKIDRVESVKDYAQIIDILNNLQIVSSAVLLQVKDRELSFRLGINGSLNQLKYALRLKRKLHFLNQAEEPSQFDQDLSKVQGVEFEVDVKTKDNQIVKAGVSETKNTSELIKDSDHPVEATKEILPVLKYQWIKG